MIRKLRIKLVAVSMISVSIVLIVIMAVINILNYQQVITDSDEILSVLAANGGSFKSLGNHDSLQLTQDDEIKKQDGSQHPSLEDMSPETPYESRYFSVEINQNGTIVSVDTGKIVSVDTETAMSYAKSVYNSSKSRGFISNYRYLKGTYDSDTIIVFLDCTKSLSTFRSFLFYSAVVSAFGLLAVFALVMLLSGKITHPVLESYEKQKSFITDAGHEIKTPLTIIDADATVLEMECGENEWISDIHSQTKRLTELTKDLIYLSRMQEENNKLQFIDFPLSDMLVEAAQSFQSLAIVQGKTFTVDVEPMLSICGDEKSIQQLINILLDNAIKYSDENGSISLTAKKKGRGVCISVCNTAEDVSQESLRRMFDRFYRGDKSRNSQGGYGLGLSIAKAVVESHKGKISAASRDGKSVLITVVL